MADAVEADLTNLEDAARRAKAGADAATRAARSAESAAQNLKAQVDSVSGSLGAIASAASLMRDTAEATGALSEGSLASDAVDVGVGIAGGFAIGAQVGSLILPGPGTLIGGGIGATVGGGLSVSNIMARDEAEQARAAILNRRDPLETYRSMTAGHYQPAPRRF